MADAALVDPAPAITTAPAGLTVAGLSVAFPSRSGWLQALDGVGLTLPPGGVLGLVGESGSGKSTVLLALLGLLGPAARVGGTLHYAGHDLRQAAGSLRGRRIGMVFQDTAAALNPALTVGMQLTEPMRLHLGLPQPEAWARATALLAETGLPRPGHVMRSYAHQLSGGMKQRVGIAAALAIEPDLLLLDEPTTALDVTIEAQILALLDQLRARRRLSMLLVSHNLAIADRLCDEVAVLYAGRVVETGAAADVLRRPRHPYTRGLLAALLRPDRPHAGRLAPIPGGLPDLTQPDSGCNFRPRCPFTAAGCNQPQALHLPLPRAGEGWGEGASAANIPFYDAQSALTPSLSHHRAACHRADAILGQPWPAAAALAAMPRPAATAPLLQAEGLAVRFHQGGWLARALGRASFVQAVDGVSLTIRPGEVVGLVGESGCGKSTLGRLLLRLIPAQSGTLHFAGQTVAARPGPAFRRGAQIVFQNPDTALNPRQTVGASLGRALRWFGVRGPDVAPQTGHLLDLVRLPRRYADRFPHQLSGGEKQRVGIARALASNPGFLVCDEAVSALDVSVQAAVLNLLSDLRADLGVAFLFISHDIGVIAHIADRVVVMFAGSVLEQGATADVLRPPYHPYTELLLSSVPLIGRAHRPPRVVSRPAPAATGCKFAARCARHIGPACDTTAPPWQDAGGGHGLACHIPLASLRAMPHWLDPP